MSNNELKSFLEHHYYPLKESLNGRLYEESHTYNRDRNKYQRDYSRILYSTSFRRLQGKMQLFGIKSDKFYRNRLTHSFEVAQIARSIASLLKEKSKIDDLYTNDMYVIEAGSLAHDIGNPPFGHHGEKILNNLMKDYGGFEGNAQTLRVLNKLEKKLPKHRGLNLSLRTILSTVKYYKKYNKGEEKFIYEEDFDMLAEKLEGSEITPRTVDVQIVDLADEIAYAAHDLEDALSLKIFNIDEFLYEFENEDCLLTELVTQAKKVAEQGEVYQSSEEYGFLFRKELTSNLVDSLARDIGVVLVEEKDIRKTGTQNKYELDFMNHGDLVKKLKNFTFKSINRQNNVQLYEKQGEVVVKSLFDALSDQKFNKDNLLLPVEFRDENECRSRNICDFISGMMDSYAFSFYEKLYGKESLKGIYNSSYFRNYNY